MTYEMDPEAVARHVDALLVKCSIVCLNCFAPRDVIARPRIDAGVCTCGSVGWSTLDALIRDPAYIIDRTESTHATTH